ncbi:MAG TPA: protein-L-isoaspartate(D-aspartate) O-methyltransferase [Methylocella sp.]|nr:protein-L-isoaspartate(D-aspartate) O-methyltransferase [Methylocella sp.]
MSIAEPVSSFTKKPNEAQDRAEFLMMLRARGIQDLDLLRAVETVPREIFVPYRFADLAGRPIALPLRCGQTLPEPWLTARMIEALAVAPHYRVLEIGTGSGYATALLGRLSREVLSIERFQSLAIEAEERLARLSIANAAVVFGDGLALPPTTGPFDRIIVQGLLCEVPEGLIALLGENGLIVAARPDRKTSLRQHIARITRNEASGIEESPVCPCRMQALLPGEAAAL